MRVKIEHINHYDKNNQGVPYTGKYGPYSLCRILTTIEGEKKTISGIDDKSGITKSWKENDEIEVNIEKKVVGENTYYNFKLPDQRVSREEFEIMKKKVKFLDDEVVFLHKEIEQLKNPVNVKDTIETIEDFHFPGLEELCEPPDESVAI